MILFLSDIHFGRGTEAAERRKEAALIACLRAHEGQVRRLYLLGDVFDQYIEYRHLVPKGFLRFQALLAAWTDRGVPVTYLVGNHDPWHRDYFGRELGVRLVQDDLVEPLVGCNVYMTHGDGIDPGSRLYNRLKPWLRHPVPVSLYRTLLPGDAGFGLARWVNRHFGTERLDPARAQALRTHARRLLRERALDLVVMGHSHMAERCCWPEGQYVNTGCWHESHTFARLDEEGANLLRWNGSCTEVVRPPGTRPGPSCAA